MAQAINLSDNYYGTLCKIVFTGSHLSQQDEINIKNEFPDFDVKEIGYQSDNGYKYQLAIFEKAAN